MCWRVYLPIFDRYLSTSLQKKISSKKITIQRLYPGNQEVTCRKIAFLLYLSNKHKTESVCLSFMQYALHFFYYFSLRSPALVVSVQYYIYVPIITKKIYKIFMISILQLQGPSARSSSSTEGRKTLGNR